MKTLTCALLSALLALTALDAQAGGRFVLQGSKAHLYFDVVIYSDKTSPGMARVLRDYTNRAWRGQGLLDGDQAVPQSVTYQGRRYQIEPHIKVRAMNNTDGEAAALANTDRTTNYFYVNYGRSGGGTVSYVPDLGTSCGFLEVNMQLDTLAHEMGHNLRLSHRDQTGARPPLMFPWVDVAAVLQDADVNQIALPAPDADGSFTIGRLCSRDETLMGEPEEGLSWDFASLATESIGDLRVFPNPAARGQPVKATFKSTSDDAGELQIYDLQGRQISRQPIAILEGDNVVTLDSSRFPSTGTYVVRVVRKGLEGRQPTTKLIVL
jgi:hypothetical protein